MKPWVKTYRPKTQEDLVGQRQVYDRVKEYILSYKRGTKPLILAGTCGVGKTSTVEVVAEELDREVIEINASDTRNKAAVESLVGAASQQRSLFFRERIILIDEVDGVSGVKDRGAVPTLVKLMAESSHPIIFTANDAQSDKLKALRKKAEVITLTHASASEIVERLEYIAKAESLTVDDGVLLGIAHRSGGDLRSAINDLQSLAIDRTITKEELDLLDTREHEEAIESALLRVFKTTSADVALPAFDGVNMQPQEIISWMEYNLPKEYTKPEDRARGMQALAEADLFFGRIRRWQYYRFYVYLYNFLSAGVACAKDEKYKTAPKYERSKRGLMIWMANMKNAKRNRLAEQLAEQLHISKKQMITDVMPYLKYACKNKEFKQQLIETYELDKDASAWL